VHYLRAGLFTCPQTGVALAALLKLIQKKVVRKNDRVVVISTAHGLKFSQFKVDYHEKKLAGVKSQFPNPPIFLPADVKAVRKALDKVIKG
jgi:threonine synthase